MKRTWLEITAGEAPHMATRYDVETGEIVPLTKRVGFVDRKLKRINAEVDDKAEWQRLVLKRINQVMVLSGVVTHFYLLGKIFFTHTEIIIFKNGSKNQLMACLVNIAKIISYNLFQMDGLKYIIPLTEKRVKIMNWETNKMEFFDKGVR